MRIYFLLFASLLISGTALQAQKNDARCQELQDYVELNKNNAAPQEFELAQDLMQAKILEGEEQKQSNRELKRLRQNVRNHYWEKRFRKANAARFSTASSACAANSGTKGILPIDNPNLDADCSLSIAVIIDQSGSIIAEEEEDIQMALEAFVNSNEGSGNAVRLFGMADETSEVNMSQQVGFGAANAGAPLIDWIYNEDYGLFSGTDGNDNWYTGLEAVESEMPNVDLVLIISDGSNNTSAENIAAANALKENGAHLFAFGKALGNYPYSGNNGNDFLDDFLDNDLMPGPIEAATAAIEDIATTDYREFDNFETLTEWMTDLDFVFVSDGVFTNLPECVPDGGSFSVTIQYTGIQNTAFFAGIGSSNSDYTYNFHFFGSNSIGTTLTVYLTSNTCTCDGEPIIIKVKQKGCSKEKFLVSENIPCCAATCQNVLVYKWKSGPCEIYNGMIARPFSCIVSSTQELTDVTGVNDLTSCASTLENLSFTLIGGNSMAIEGLIVFIDPDCTSNADVTLQLEYDNMDCCLIEHTYNFLDCGLPKECTANPPTATVLFTNEDAFDLNISVALPLGTYVQVTDNTTGLTTLGNVIQDIVCTNTGDLCTGISIPIIDNIDCEEGINPAFDYTITYGDCIWHVADDYCDVDPFECQLAAQLIIGVASNPSITIAIDWPIGSTVMLTNNITSDIGSYVVQQIECAPFQNLPGGGQGNGTPCNGIVVPIGMELDCMEHNANVDFIFDYSIDGLPCDVVGNYCDMPANIIGSGMNTPGSQPKLASNHNDFVSQQDRFAVYPNPLLIGDAVHFDFSDVKNKVRQIEMIDTDGHRIDLLKGGKTSTQMTYHFTTATSAGVYFINVELDNGEVLRKKVVLLSSK